MEPKILHLTGMRSTKYGAIERYFVELARACREYGHQTVIQYEDWPESAAYRRDLNDLGVELLCIRTHRHSIRVGWQLWNLVRSTRPAIVTTHFCGTAVRLMTPLFSRLAGVRLSVAFVHGLLHMKKRSWGRFAFNCYDKVLGVSEAVTRDLMGGGVKPRLLATHYLGLFGDRERSSTLRTTFRREFGIPDDATVIACIGFDRPFKGLDVLLEAFGRLASDHPSLRLLIVGVDPERSSLPRRAAEMGITSQLCWAGIRDDGWRILNAADLYVQPSRLEALGLAIVEAMALRLPVIGSRIGGIPEAVIDGVTGCLVEPGSPTSLAAALQAMLGNPARSEEMGRAGRLRYSSVFQGRESVRILVREHLALARGQEVKLRDQGP